MRSKLCLWVISLMLMLAVHVGQTDAAIRTGFDSHTLAANDDQSTGRVDIGFTINLWGTEYDRLYVNNNGNVTFDSALAAFTPFNLEATNVKIIAPFFADVDTRGTGSDAVQYGQGTVDGRTAFGATYGSDNGVGYFSRKTDKLNKFQVVLIDRSDIGAGNFDIEFNYDQIQWETGDASDGSDGLGGSSARAGYSNGLRDELNKSFELAGSGVNGAFLDGGPSDTALVSNSGNSDVAGQAVFAARNGEVSSRPPNGEIPEPVGGAVWALMAVLGFAIIRRYHR